MACFVKFKFKLKLIFFFTLFIEKKHLNIANELSSWLLTCKDASWRSPRVKYN